MPLITIKSKHNGLLIKHRCLTQSSCLKLAKSLVSVYQVQASVNTKNTRYQQFESSDVSMRIYISGTQSFQMQYANHALKTFNGLSGLRPLYFQN